MPEKAAKLHLEYAQDCSTPYYLLLQKRKKTFGHRFLLPHLYALWIVIIGGENDTAVGPEK